jgi:Fic family protein
MDADEPFVHGWQPIALPDESLMAYASRENQQLQSLANVWLAQQAELREVSPENLRLFMGRLVRSWAIETGILERLYDLDEGATQTLIEHGFRSDFIQHGATRLEPETLVRVLRDHQAAAEMVLELVQEDRPITKHFIRELHQLLTRNQSETEAVTEDGVPITVPMEHGVWKKWANNPARPDGEIHEYAPPEHVDAEIDRLVGGYGQLEGAPVAVAAAWLHHRFTQIHPFQDGNGRVARGLTNFVFVKAGLFPLDIHREDRVEYIAALEEADRGDLSALIDLFARIQARTVLDALAVARDEDERGKRTALDSVVGKLADRFGKQIQDRQSVLRSVNEVGRHLQQRGEAYLAGRANDAIAEINRSGASLRIYHDHGGLGSGTEHWWKAQLVESANEQEYWINFAEGQYWIRVAINDGPVELRYVASLHHIGRELTGVMRAAAFVEFDVPGEEGSHRESKDPADRLRHSCTPTMFSFTWQEEAEQLGPTFDNWLEESFAMALRRWVDLF